MAYDLNGMTQPMTQDEIADMYAKAPIVEPTPTPEEQIAELQAKLDEMQAENEVYAGAIEELAAMCAEE